MKMGFATVTVTLSKDEKAICLFKVGRNCTKKKNDNTFLENEKKKKIHIFMYIWNKCGKPKAVE